MTYMEFIKSMFRNAEKRFIDNKKFLQEWSLWMLQNNLQTDETAIWLKAEIRDQLNSDKIWMGKLRAELEDPNASVRKYYENKN